MAKRILRRLVATRVAGLLRTRGCRFVHYLPNCSGACHQTHYVVALSFMGYYYARSSAAQLQSMYNFNLPLRTNSNASSRTSTNTPQVLAPERCNVLRSFFRDNVILYAGRERDLRLVGEEGVVFRSHGIGKVTDLTTWE